MAGVVYSWRTKHQGDIEETEKHPETPRNSVSSVPLIERSPCLVVGALTEGAEKRYES